MQIVNRIVYRACMAIGLSLIVAWVASVFGSFQYGQKNRSFGVRHGAIEFSRINTHFASTPIEQALMDDIAEALCPSGFRFHFGSHAVGTCKAQSVINRIGLLLPSRSEPELKVSHICGSWKSWDLPPSAPFGGKGNCRPRTTWTIPIWIPISALTMIATFAGALRRGASKEVAQIDSGPEAVLETPNPLTIRPV